MSQSAPRNLREAAEWSANGIGLGLENIEHFLQALEEKKYIRATHLLIVYPQLLGLKPLWVSGVCHPNMTAFLDATFGKKEREKYRTALEEAVLSCNQSSSATHVKAILDILKEYPFALRTEEVRDTLNGILKTVPNDEMIKAIITTVGNHDGIPSDDIFKPFIKALQVQDRAGNTRALGCLESDDRLLAVSCIFIWKGEELSFYEDLPHFAECCPSSMSEYIKTACIKKTESESESRRAAEPPIPSPSSTEHPTTGGGAAGPEAKPPTRKKAKQPQKKAAPPLTPEEKEEKKLDDTAKFLESKWAEVRKTRISPDTLKEHLTAALKDLPKTFSGTHQPYADTLYYDTYQRLIKHYESCRAKVPKEITTLFQAYEEKLIQYGMIIPSAITQKLTELKQKHIDTPEALNSDIAKYIITPEGELHLETLKKVPKESFNYARAQEDLGKLYQKAGHPKEALSCFWEGAQCQQKTFGSSKIILANNKESIESCCSEFCATAFDVLNKTKPLEDKLTRANLAKTYPPLGVNKPYTPDLFNKPEELASILSDFINSHHKAIGNEQLRIASQKEGLLFYGNPQGRGPGNPSPES